MKIIRKKRCVNLLPTPYSSQLLASSVTVTPVCSDKKPLAVIMEQSLAEGFVPCLMIVFAGNYTLYCGII